MIKLSLATNANIYKSKNSCNIEVDKIFKIIDIKNNKKIKKIIKLLTYYLQHLNDCSNTIKYNRKS